MGIFRRRPSDLQPGEATVLFSTLTAKAARQTGKRNLDHEVRLAVDRPEGGTREVTLEATVPWDRSLRIGASIPVRISPTEPEYVEIDFDSMKSMNDFGNAAVQAAREGRPPTPEELGFTPADPDS